MGPQGRGRPMLEVELDEVEQDSAAPRADRGSGLLWSWIRRRPWVGLTVGALCAGLLVSFLVVAPQVSSQRERRAVLGAAPFDGAVRSLAHAPGTRWSAATSPSMTPLLVGDVVVAAVDDPTTRLVGLDVVTGAQRWELGPFSSAGAPVRECTPAGSRVVCVLGLGGRGLRPPSRLVVLDPVSGQVVATREIEGRWVEVEAAGDDVVLAGWLPDGLGVVRVDPSSGAVRWRAQTSRQAHPREAGNVGLVVHGDTVLASSSSSYLVARLSDGRALPVADADDVVRLQPDGAYVGTRFTVQAGSVAAVSTVADSTGQVIRTVEGEVADPPVRDPASPLVLTVEGGTDEVILRAYGSDDEPTWSTDDGTGSVVLDAADRVLLRREGALVGLDARTGERVWQRPVVGQPRASLARSVFSDAQRVAVVALQPEGPPALVALRLDDGEPLWQLVLPDDTRRVLRLGSQLYVQADDRLVALR